MGCKKKIGNVVCFLTMGIEWVRIDWVGDRWVKNVCVVGVVLGGGGSWDMGWCEMGGLGVLGRGWGGGGVLVLGCEKKTCIVVCFLTISMGGWVGGWVGVRIVGEG